MHFPSRWKGLLAGGVLLCAGSGCVTVNSDGATFSWKRATKPDVEQAAYSSDVEEMPAAPKHPERLQLAYAKLMEESGKTAEAHAHYTEVVKEHPKNVEALRGLARTKIEAGQYSEAERDLKKALKLQPEDAATQFQLGQLYTVQERWQDAVPPFTKAMLSAPHDTTYRYHLAVAMVHAGDVDGALPHFIRTVGDAEAHYNVGLILQQMGRTDDAEQHLKVAVSKKPELQEAQHWLAHVRAERSGEALPTPDEKAKMVQPVGHEVQPTPPRHLGAATWIPLSGRL